VDIELQKSIIQGVATVLSAIIVAGVGTTIAKRFEQQRDRQVREKEWIDQATALTKLDLDRKLNSWPDKEKRDIRPPILDFLAYYRDLKELDTISPGDLYQKIMKQRYSPRDEEAKAGVVTSEGAPIDNR
jgi:hypothetical protein